MKYYIWFVFTVLLISSFGCIPYKRVVYFQKTAADAPDSTYINQDYEFTIAPFDILAIKMTGFTNEEGQNVLGPFNTPVSATGAATSGAGGYATGILVDKNGAVELHYIGKVKVSGLTLEQASDTIKSALSKYINVSDGGITVNLKILSYSVTVLGEVGSQGILKADNEYMTLTEAIAKSGGVTQFGNMKTVRIIRSDRLTKKTTTYRVDLTTQTPVSPILSRLQPNDIIIVDPLRRKQFSTAGQIITLLSTVITVPLLIISTVNTINSLTK
ncbi:polysaccharide biosynthesis/export family protein [Cytophagaceae bacterium YF14B1]|uniref:Polysaccharide biosynthesis/export family protein n=1 Tax=Xanthocytophaga flava TaxID=3048013 RepID=A0AAE3QKD5_9BACT|nr:polysaccharide biosynthesis/export family protein [Xanthocytophaga flavus]MDJ1480982.1 polysaccharide biosynthesis/export family protein [Xanthocytophaga flavus]